MSETSSSPDTATPVAIDLSFVEPESSSRTAVEYARVRIPLARLPEWKALFANGSTARIEYDSESNVFLLMPTTSAPIATTSPPISTGWQMSDNTSAQSSEGSSTSPFVILLLVTTAVVVAVVVLFIVVRKRFRTHRIPGLFSTMLASVRQSSASDMVDGGLAHGWSEWSASSHNVLSVCESPKRAALNSNVLLSAQETPKRVPLIIYEGEHNFDCQGAKAAAVGREAIHRESREEMVKSLGKARKYTVAELVAKAETLVDQCQPELAVQFYERALLKEPNSTALLDMVGELSTELNNPERALEAFQKSIAVAPAQNPGKWFYVAQLVAGEEAEKYSLQGIQYLLQELQQLDQQSNDALIVKKQLCDAYCGLGELYMTDLCDEDNAEERCETYFTQAMNYDIGLPEPTQAFANLRLTQQRPEEAIPLLEETYRRLNESCDENSMPPLEFRVFTGKLLIEVEKYEEACDVLEGVMQEDDENAELWFLVATCYRAMDDLANALEFFERCAKMLKKLKKEFQDGFQLQDQLESVEQSIASIKEAIANRPEGEDDENSDDDGESEGTGGEMEDVEMEE